MYKSRSGSSHPDLLRQAEPVWRLLCPVTVRLMDESPTPDDKKIVAMSKMSIESDKQNGKNADRTVVDAEPYPFQTVPSRH